MYLTNNKNNISEHKQKIPKATGGIIKDKKDILTGFIKSYLKGHIFHSYENNIYGLTQFIVDLEILYKKVGNEYKLMEFRSIETYIRELMPTIKQELEQENKQKIKYASKH